MANLPNGGYCVQMFHIDDQTKLVRELFACAAASFGGNQTKWQPFLGSLGTLVRADGVWLSIGWPEGSSSKWSTGTGAAIDELRLDGLRVDRVYRQSEMQGADPASGYFRVVRVQGRLASRAVLGIHRTAHKDDFRSIDGQLLSILAGFLDEAADIWAQRQIERLALDESEQLNRRLGVGWIRLDLSGSVMGSSSFAREWSEEAGFQITERRRFDHPDSSTAHAFNVAFSACVADGSPRSVVLSVEPLVEMLLRIDTRGGQRTVVVQLRKTPSFTTFSANQIAAHFGLSNSEARLVAHLCDGHSIRSAARELGWTEETARTCSKAVFSRLDVHGQPALLRRALNSTVWMAAP